MAQGYIQIKWFYLYETFGLVSYLEVIKLLLGLSFLLRFKLYYMDVKSTFLIGYLNEEVYVEKPKGFIDQCIPNYVYKLRKVLYGLKQTHGA